MNYYKNLNWSMLLKKYPDTKERKFDVQEYHKILSNEFPDFLKEYIHTTAMQRLSGIGLLCGTDWTQLYKNRFYYSRLDHSIGVALIVYNFTKDKRQTLAGLFHDISTPIFSHASDFRKGDALTQTASENDTEKMIRESKEITALLEKDGIAVSEIADYHKYPVADNEVPQLSADRLEYMFPSGGALLGSWSLTEIQNVYDKIAVLKNEDEVDELGFTSLSEAEIYCEKFLETGHVLQLNEDKLTLQLLAEITNYGIELGIITEEDCLKISEKEAFSRMKKAAENSNDNSEIFRRFRKLLKTFYTMTKIEHSESPLENHFCVNLKVKQRYINPLVKIPGASKALRLSEISKKSDTLIKDFLQFSDSCYGCVPFAL